MILESFDAEKRIAQLEALLEKAGHGKLLPMKPPMARSLASRLDRLERLARELLNPRSGPVYLREGSEVPAGVDPDRVIYIRRVLIDPPEQSAEELPEALNLHRR